MPCVMCKKTVTFKSTVFRGTSPTTIKLCDECATKVRAEQRIQEIKAAPNHDAKMAAIDEFLSELGIQ
jgi:hypothetical protein